MSYSDPYHNKRLTAYFNYIKDQKFGEAAGFRFEIDGFGSFLSVRTPSEGSLSLRVAPKVSGEGFEHSIVWGTSVLMIDNGEGVKKPASFNTGDEALEIFHQALQKLANEYQLSHADKGGLIDALEHARTVEDRTLRIS